jgi:hypothetical protein
MSPIARIAALLILFAGPAQAGGEWLGEGESYRQEGPTSFARGCYWRRGERYCSTYCYLEINGKRYCNQRESEAVPQGDPYKPVRPTVEELYRQPPGSR